MAGILTVVFGLALPTVGQNTHTDQGQAAVAGIALTAMGTLFYALEYVLCERVYTLYDKPVDAKQLCFYTGAWGLGFTGAPRNSAQFYAQVSDARSVLSGVWMVCFTIPHWQEVVADEVAARGGDVLWILFLYATHCLNNSVHNLAWFVICELEGGVSTGLLMGVKAALLFFASAVFFCDSTHPEQCLTPSKGIATVVVLQAPPSTTRRRRSCRGCRARAGRAPRTSRGRARRRAERRWRRRRARRRAERGRRRWRRRRRRSGGDGAAGEAAADGGGGNNGAGGGRRRGGRRQGGRSTGGGGAATFDWQTRTMMLRATTRTTAAPTLTMARRPPPAA